MTDEYVIRQRQAFRRVWAQCERQGWCDAIDGAEYRRVSAEWEAAGRPASVARFIRWRCNLMGACGGISTMEDQS
jgi:hypothetical protein